MSSSEFEEFTEDCQSGLYSKYRPVVATARCVNEVTMNVPMSSSSSDEDADVQQSDEDADVQQSDEDADVQQSDEDADVQQSDEDADVQQSDEDADVQQSDEDADVQQSDEDADVQQRDEDASSPDVWPMCAESPHTDKSSDSDRHESDAPDETPRHPPVKRSLPQFAQNRAQPKDRTQIRIVPFGGGAQYSGGLVNLSDPSYHVVLPNGAWDESRERAAHFHSMQGQLGIVWDVGSGDTVFNHLPEEVWDGLVYGFIGDYFIVFWLLIVFCLLR